MIMECNGVLVAMDQHAADERVRLETLRNRLLAAVAAGAGRQSPASAPAQPVAGHSRHAGKAATARSGCSAAATVAEDSSTIVGTQPGEATAAALRLPMAEPAELLASETTASSAGCGLSDSEWHLCEAYRGQVERYACASCWNLLSVRPSRCCTTILTTAMNRGGAGEWNASWTAQVSWHCRAYVERC